MHHPRAGVQNEVKPQNVAKEANMSNIAKRRGKENRGQVDFNGKACWVRRGRSQNQLLGGDPE